jgi:hypothetical protein
MKQIFKHLTLAKITDIMLWTLIYTLGTMAVSGIGFMIFMLVTGQVTNVHIPCDICY